jgi:hypothetical protein
MPEDFASVAMNASNNSLVDVVENEGDVMFEPDPDRLVETVTSVAMVHHARAATKNVRTIPRIHPIAKRQELRSMSLGVNMISFLLYLSVCGLLTIASGEMLNLTLPEAPVTVTGVLATCKNRIAIVSAAAMLLG